MSIGHLSAIARCACENGFISEMRSTLVRPLECGEFHDNLRRSSSILGSFVAHPIVRRFYSEPEIGFRNQETEQVENTESRTQLHLVALKLASRRSNALSPTYFKADVI